MRKFNTLGLLFVMTAAPVGFLAQFLAGSSDPVFPVYFSGPLLAILDGAYRLRNDSYLGRQKWLARDAGGYLVLVPIWIWGIGLFLYALAAAVNSGFG